MTVIDDTEHQRITHALSFEDTTLLPELVGEHNSNLQIMEHALELSIETRGNEIHVSGEHSHVQAAQDILYVLWDRLKKKQNVTSQDVKAAIRFHQNPQREENGYSIEDYLDDKTVIHLKKKSLSPRSPRQAEYIKAMNSHDMVFGIGPAGTGKTYLAVAMAVSLYQKKEIERMIFCRPAVEAGEHLGFLPGDMQEKIDPYLRPIYDALHDMMHIRDVEKLIEDGRIEIAPLAFMRGRTLKNAFVVMDEAQNTTSMQMKMFLTRMGEGTRMVVNGDITQIDLPKGTHSGLIEAEKILKNVHEIAKIHFTSEDVIRHGLVSKIINAYEKAKK